jgi:putative peptide maturation dehydrogenase
MTEGSTAAPELTVPASTSTPRIRRSTYLFFCFQDGSFVDVEALLTGRAELTRIKQIYAVSVLCGDLYPITLDELLLLHATPSDEWIGSSDILERHTQFSLEMVDGLCRKGLLLSDRNDKLLAELRRRHDTLASTQWNIFAALFHFMTKWRDVHLAIDLPDDLETLAENAHKDEDVMGQFLKLHGKPPQEFHSAPSIVETFELPLVERCHPLYELLRERKTTRAYDRSKAMSAEDLATALYYVWGCHGLYRICDDVVGLKKTSPSGGGLHPIEVYPLVVNVEDVRPGLYHYNVQRHQLEAIEFLTRSEAEELANEFTSGQSYPRHAHALFIMTARYFRNFWKYRKHQKAYTVINMDAAHLSQTFYLVCAELGLGAFVTAAINGFNIEERLGLDGFIEGATAICGCGVRRDDVGLDPVFSPYVPGQTQG